MSPDQFNPKSDPARSQNRAAAAFSRIERVPPLLLILYLSMVAVGVLFALLLGGFLHARFTVPAQLGAYPLPRLFSLSTLVLLASSYTLSQARRLYAADDLPMLSRCLAATFLLGSVFSVLQVLGWSELLGQSPHLVPENLSQQETSTVYVYLLSTLHVVHLLGGMLFLLILTVRTNHANRDAIRTLLFIRNPYRRLQLRMMSIYWHFLDALWLVLFACFLFCY